MGAEEPIRLVPWYLNSRRLGNLTGASIGSAAQRSLNQNDSDRAQGMFMASRVADAIIASGRVPNLVSLVIKGGIPSTRVLATLWGKMTFRGLTKSLEAELQGRKIAPASFSGSIPIGDSDF